MQNKTPRGKGGSFWQNIAHVHMDKNLEVDFNWSSNKKAKGYLEDSAGCKLNVEAIWCHIRWGMVLLTPPVWLHDSGSSKEAASSKFGWWYFVRSKITSAKDGTQTSHLILQLKVGRKNCQHAPKSKFLILYLIQLIHCNYQKKLHKVLQQDHPSLSDHQKR